MRCTLQDAAGQAYDTAAQKGEEAKGAAQDTKEQAKGAAKDTKKQAEVRTCRTASHLTRGRGQQ